MMGRKPAIRAVRSIGDIGLFNSFRRAMNEWQERR